MFLGSLFHRVGPAQANARRPKRSRLTAERSERGGVWRRSSAARYSGVPLYMALCTSTSSLKSIRFLTGSQCNCRSIVVMDCRSPRRICPTIRAADRWTISRRSQCNCRCVVGLDCAVVLPFVLFVLQSLAFDCAVSSYAYNIACLCRVVSVRVRV
ncbi:hypothetical protein NP493_888g02021 [Ridgeia piscesae]|uniref:Uncharacterized protein n=1 Tax=Ridgeia piscesae TaxID=27915 RepID=A0AAD9NK43_RIDPI|nr:hypothetical protein NP493_888g02021 [Ridgeia piscesae]